MKLRNKKTGENGYFYFANWNDPVLLIIDKNGVQLAKYSSIAELTSEWEDAPEEPKIHYIINPNGFIVTDKHLHSDTIKEVKDFGNYFETREEAEKAVEKLKAWKRLKDKGFRLSSVVDDFFCLDIYISDESYEAIKDELKIVFGSEE